MEIKLTNVCSKKLTDINTVFSENEITSLIGSNGSGKTEILNIIFGLEKYSGIIKYGRKKLDSNVNSKKNIEIRNDIYYLKENYKSMLFNISIKEDMKFYLGKYDEEQLFDLLKKFNLDKNILSKNYLELSSSEIKKILLIIAFLTPAKVIILANPTSNLDKNTVQTLIKNLKNLKRNNKIILLTSYNTNFLLEVSDKIIILNDNTIFEGTKFDILSNEKLLRKINLSMPDVLKFSNKVKELKNIKIGYRDNINDLIKDIYRYAK